MNTVIGRLNDMQRELRNMRGIVLSDSEQVTLDRCVELHRAITLTRSALIDLDIALFVRHRRLLAETRDGRSLEEALHERIMEPYQDATLMPANIGCNEPPDAATLRAIDEIP